MYNTKYILGFTNDLNELYEIYFEFLGYSGVITQLQATDDVLTIRSTSGDENKLESILGTEALINILVDIDQPITISDLIAQHDNDIRVTIYRDEDYTKNVFQGFIVVEDNSQPFLDPPFILSLRALDGLGLLKGVDLVDTNNLLFVGNQSVLSWIAQILAKTDQTLNLRVYFNFFESSFATNIGALEQVYLNAITFSQGDAFNSTPTDPTVDVASTAADDCYTALEKIVRCFRCRLFQEDGRWNLVSLYEYLNPAGFSYKEYSFGAPVLGIVPVAVVSSGINQDYSLAIGKNELVHPTNEDQILYLKLATKWVKLTYAYDQALNKVCNQDFSEGDRNATFDEVISSSILDPTISPAVNLQTQGYDAYCWGHFNGTVETVSSSTANSPKPSTAPSKNAFIRSVVDLLGFEKERYLVIQNDPGKLSYMQAATFRADISDIIQLSVSTRVRAGTIHAQPQMYLLLTGDDGTFWSLFTVGDGSVPGNLPVWKQTTSTFRQSTGGRPNIVPDNVTISQDYSNWTTFSANNNISGLVPPAKMPVNGTLTLLLACETLSGTDPLEYWYKELQITILPYLNGSYQQLKGDYNYSASNNNIKKTEADDVEISDSPKRYFKGALLRANGDLCTPTWGRSGLPMPESFRFTQLMERIMFNHLRRIVQKIEGTFRGLVYLPVDDITVIRPNGFLNSCTLTDGDVPTKRFMMTSFEKDYGSGQSRSVLVETLNDQNDTGFTLPDAYQFSYIFQ